MKNGLIPLVFIILFTGILGCEKGKKLTEFDMDYEQTLIIPSSTGVDLPVNLMTPKMESNSESKFEVNDTRKNLIREINLTSVQLAVEIPDGEDFSFLESIRIFLNADELDELEIAWNTTVAESAASPLNLEVTDKDLKEYIKQDEFSLRCNVITDEVLTSDYHINILSTYAVDASLIK